MGGRKMAWRADSPYLTSLVKKATKVPTSTYINIQEYKVLLQTSAMPYSVCFQIYLKIYALS